MFELLQPNSVTYSETTNQNVAFDANKLLLKSE